MGFTQSLIRNEAMKADPEEIYNIHVLLITIASCSGVLIYGMDMGAMGGILTMPEFKAAYGLEKKTETQAANLESNILSVIQAGSFFGSLIASPIASRVGHRPSLISISVIVLIGVAMQAAASGILAVLYVGRFVAGLGVGMASTISPLYVSENAPRAIRGLLTGIYQFNIVTGLCLAFWINYGSLRNQTGAAQYAVPLAMQALPSLILFVGMLLANESPRYLAQKNPRAALATLSKLRRLPETHPYIQEEMGGLELQLSQDEALFESSSRWVLVKELVTIPSNRYRAFLSVTLMFFSNFVGTNAMNYYSPQIFALMGVSSSKSGLFATGIYGFVKMAACAIFILFVSDTLGRRKSLIWTGAAQACALFYIGVYLRVAPPKEGDSIPPAGYISLVAVFLFAAIYQFGWGPVVWTYCSEIPSARLRPLTMGIATSMQWIFAFAVAKATPVMFATLGESGFGTFFLYGSFCFLASVFAFIWIPETKAVTLEQMDELFAGNTVFGRSHPNKDKVDMKAETEHIERA